MYYAPETKGLALEEIPVLFGDAVGMHLSEAKEKHDQADTSLQH